MLEEEVRCEGERVWEMNRCGQTERDRGNENRIAKSIYIDPQYFSTDRDVEPSIEEGVKKNNVDRCSCREGVEEKAKTQKQTLNRSTSYQEAIEDPGTFSIDPPAIKDLSRLR